MALSQKQILKQTQKIELSKIMLMNLIQTPNEELYNVIRKEVDENPALEIEHHEESNDYAEGTSHDPISIDDLREQASESSYEGSADDWDDFIRRDPNETHYERPIATTISFRDKLLMQLGGLNLSENENFIAEYLIGNLEDSGYLLRDLSAIAMDLLVQYNLSATENEIENILTQVIQNMEPAGTGARNLQECMLIQLKQQYQVQKSTVLKMAIKVVENYFDDLTKKNYSHILKGEKMEMSTWRSVLDCIQKLIPYPGESSAIPHYAIPDFSITIENGELCLNKINDYRPKLRVSKEYEDMYARYRKNKNQEVLKFVNENIEKAKSFITALPERDRTVYLIVNEMMKMQRDFFLSGDRKQLKPMVLKDVAEKVNLDVSTISRATSRRYVQTPFGILLLKDIFTEATNEKDGISSEVIKQEIKELIEKEDKKDPLTDEKLAALLLKQGYQISRRTVAKYREQLGISATSLRKEK